LASSQARQQVIPPESADEPTRERPAPSRRRSWRCERRGDRVWPRSLSDSPLFGVGAVRELPAHLARFGVRRPLVVTDPGLVNTDAFRALSAQLGPAGCNRDWFLFGQVHPNPVEDDVRLPAALMREKGCDGVIAFGGGSPLDAGKAARLLAKHPDFPLARLYDDHADWTGMAPLIAIPTTAGTGSEVGRSSVITSTPRNERRCFHPNCSRSLSSSIPNSPSACHPNYRRHWQTPYPLHRELYLPGLPSMCDGIAARDPPDREALPRASAPGPTSTRAARCWWPPPWVPPSRRTGVVHS
jgi:hypothetical protein